MASTYFLSRLEGRPGHKQPFNQVLPSPLLLVLITLGWLHMCAHVDTWKRGGWVGELVGWLVGLHDAIDFCYFVGSSLVTYGLDLHARSSPCTTLPTTCKEEVRKGRMSRPARAHLSSSPCSYVVSNTRTAKAPVTLLPQTSIHPSIPALKEPGSKYYHHYYDERESANKVSAYCARDGMDAERGAAMNVFQRLWGLSGPHQKFRLVEIQPG